MDHRTRYWASLDYFDPVPVLRYLRSVELGIRDLPPELVELSDRASRLRTNVLRDAREARDAALFAHGMSAMIGSKVCYAPVEESDYDFVTVCVIEETQYFTPVQLKEVPPADLAPDASLGGIFEGLRMYSPTDTVLAINYNRRERIDLSSLEVPEIPFGEVWVFACTSPDQKSWILMGDFLGKPQQVSFGYPDP